MEAFQASRHHNEIHAVRDGLEAMEFLTNRGQHAQAPRPDLVLLDLNLPRMNGREVLAEIKSNPALRSIPVVVLTTSTAPRDVQAAYDLHANCYITKPIDLNEFTEAVDTIERFWHTAQSVRQLR